MKLTKLDRDEKVPVGTLEAGTFFLCHAGGLCQVVKNHPSDREGEPRVVRLGNGACHTWNPDNLVLPVEVREVVFR